MNKMNELLTEQGIKTVGKWADPPGHVNYLVLDAPDAHAILQVFMDSGLSAHTATEIRAVMSMG
ncbi:MAG: hypothetical protein L0196_04615 [candidate division Zixibacteria bacterium]|nr:hypothetical protein [candidate division Zixibacteria bacterium]